MADLDAAFALAATGDIEAQEAVFRHMVLAGLQPGALRPGFLDVIEVWARMLATHGRSDDQRRLAGVLLFKGSMLLLDGRNDLAAPFVEEGGRRLRELSDAGDRHAVSQLAELTRRLENGRSLPAEIMLGDAAPTSH